VTRARWVLMAFLVAAPLAAQDDSEEAIFGDGAFEAAVDQGKVSEEKNKLTWTGGVTVVSTTGLTVPSDRGAYGSQSLFTGKAFLKATNPTVGSLFVAYTYTHTLWAATDDGALSAVYAASEPDPSAPAFVLSEAHLSFDFGKIVFVRLGNQLIDWGASAVWSPADFINRRKSDPNAAIDTRAGLPGLRVHVPLGVGNLFVFADASRSITAAGLPRDLIETGSLGLKADTTVGGWNLGVVGNFGKSTDPRLGLTASGALLGIDVWAEAGSVLPVGGRSLTWAASVGGEKTFGTDSEWTLRAEGFWNPEGHLDDALTGSALAGYTAYYWGRAYVYAEAVRQKLLGPWVAGSLSGTANLGDLSWVSTASVRTTFPGTIPFSVYLQYNGGQSQREFTLATGGSALTFGLRSVLEF